MADSRYTLNKRFALEEGGSLLNPTIAYSTYGKLNRSKSNVVWVCHALTANSHVFQWWEGLFGAGGLFNEEDYFIICANVLGSHYGTTGPLSINPETGKKYYHDFPQITVRDMVRLHIELADHLSIEKIDVILGGSMGGHQAIEWSIMQAERINQLIVIAGGAKISPWASAFSSSQRSAIELDPSWIENNDQAGIEGMKVARSIALLSYRTAGIYNEKQKAKNEEFLYAENSDSYQKHQGVKLARRFNAFSYWHLSKSMDSHNIGRGRGGIKKALDKISARVLVISIENDLLYPRDEQLVIINHLSAATHKTVQSKYGHDGFLIEAKALSEEIGQFIVEKNLTVQV